MALGKWWARGISLAVSVGLAMVIPNELPRVSATEQCDGVDTPCSVGQLGPGGGIVFFDAGAEQPWGRYLEAAPLGWSQGQALYVPSRPQGLKSRVVRGTVQISWDRVSADGSIRYLVETRPKTKGCDTRRTVCKISSMRANRSYKVRVRAENEAGAGPWSKRVTVPRRTTTGSTPNRPSSPTSESEKPKPVFRSKSIASVDPAAVLCPRDSAGAEAPIPTGTAIGDGFNNSLLFAQACDGQGAAAIATGYAGGGMTDWYLPSRDELAQMYLQRRLIGGLQKGTYWSSSQVVEDPDNAYNYGFVLDDASTASKWVFDFKIRPIRAF